MGKLWFVEGKDDYRCEVVWGYDGLEKVGYVKKKENPAGCWQSREGMIHDVAVKENRDGYTRYESFSLSGYEHKSRTVAEGKLLLQEWYDKNYPNGMTEKNRGNRLRYLPSGDNEFYPTPEKLAGQMIQLVDWSSVKNILEPSAGKGDLVGNIESFYDSSQNRIRYLIHKNRYDRWNQRLFFHEHETDCIELDPNLRAVLTGKGYRVVADDFLRFNTLKHYNLIFMNPPFSNGDEHLLKAIQLQERGGQICCLLNAETLRNPCTNRRKLLLQKLTDYDAKIVYVKDGFRNAERKTDVEVAIVYLSIPEMEDTSKIFDHLVKAEQENFANSEAEALVSGNWMEQMVSMYNFEAKAGRDLLREYYAMKSYRLPNEITVSLPLLSLCVDGRNYDTLNECMNAYLKGLRQKYWSNLFQRKELTSLMTSDMQNQYGRKIDTLVDYDFTLFNIKAMMNELSMQLVGGVEQSIMKLFEKLSAEHSWYPECAKNRHYFNGWKTNQAHKVGMKAIIPVNGSFATYSDKLLDEWNISETISDLDRALHYLDNGEVTCEVPIHVAINAANIRNSTTVNFTYFSVRFYKKGTAHITFYPEMEPMIDRLNIFAAQNKGWLPPSYGKSHYANMTAEEKSVVDSFDGDGTEGSGAARYEDVLGHKSDYFLDLQSTGLLMLGA